uniref:Uncharacterized protein n=1 Tax=Anguilla anguilla TaxID=7936 RepID=A0A0E9PAP0_ANGAN
MQTVPPGFSVLRLLYAASFRSFLGWFSAKPSFVTVLMVSLHRSVVFALLLWRHQC